MIYSHAFAVPVKGAWFLVALKKHPAPNSTILQYLGQISHKFTIVVSFHDPPYPLKKTFSHVHCGPLLQVSDHVPRTLVPVKSEHFILEAVNQTTPKEEYYSLQPPDFQFSMFDFCNFQSPQSDLKCENKNFLEEMALRPVLKDKFKTEARDMLIYNQGEDIWSGLMPVQGEAEADLFYTENFEMLTQVRNDDFTIEVAALIENNDVKADTINGLLIMDDLQTWSSVQKEEDVLSSGERTKKEVPRQSDDSMVMVQSTDGEIWSVLQEGMEDYNMFHDIGGGASGEQRQEITLEPCLALEEKSCGLFLEGGSKEDKLAGILQDWSHSRLLTS